MISKQQIEEYIEIQNRGTGIGGHGDRKGIFEDIADYNIIDELFGRMMLEKNARVSIAISRKTKDLILSTFDSDTTATYFKNYINWYKPGLICIIKKPWWKFWVQKTIFK